MSTFTSSFGLRASVGGGLLPPSPKSTPNVPFTEDGALTDAGRAYLARIREDWPVAPFPCKVIVPLQDPAFVRICGHARSVEYEIASSLVQDGSHLDDAGLSHFQNHIDHNPVTKNILQRSWGEHECPNNIPAGVYLGTDRYDRNMGSELKDLLRQAYGIAFEGGDPPAALLDKCSQWGQLQSAARDLIFDASWLSLKDGRKWGDVPDVFRAYLSYLLEPNPEDFLSGGRITSFIDFDSERFPFSLWSEQVSQLERARPDKLLIDLSMQVGRWIRSRKTGQTEIPPELVEEMSVNKLEAWFNLLQDEKPETRRNLREAFWPDANARPSNYSLRDGCVSQISVSFNQLLDYWPDYLKIPTLQGVTVTMKPVPNSTPASTPAQGQPPSASDLLGKLTLLPVAPLVRCILLDACHLTPTDVRTLVINFTGFLADLAAAPWRDQGSAQPVMLELYDPSNEVWEQAPQTFPPVDRGLFHLNGAKHHTASYYRSVKIAGEVKPILGQ